MEKVSVVIPTRNRSESLYRTLAALCKQKAAIHEIIVIDSSDVPIDPSELADKVAFDACLLLHVKPSVCAQRNEGIRRATGDFIFLLDDDISVDDRYIERCLTFLRDHPAALVVTGFVVHKNSSGNWEYRSPKISFLRLVWNFLFQLDIWADLENSRKNRFTAYFFKQIQRRANGISKAGYPLRTDFSKSVVRSQIYYLGASIIRRDWLLGNLYSEKLDPHGIGDNYGVAIKLRPEQGIFILKDVYAYHYKIADNRLDADEVYYKRVLVLNYFSTLQGSASKAWLIWSLVGSLLDASLHLQMSRVILNCRLIGMLLMNRNPLFN